MFLCHLSTLNNIFFLFLFSWHPLKHTKVHGAYCLGVFQNGDSTTLLGGIQFSPSLSLSLSSFCKLFLSSNYPPLRAGIIVRNTLVTYDRENDKIGFLKTNCSELWKTLHIPGAPAPEAFIPTPKSVPAPAPVVSDDNNTAAGMPPTVAPSGLPQKVLPGRISSKNVQGLYPFLPTQICSMNLVFPYLFVIF